MVKINGGREHTHIDGQLEFCLSILAGNDFLTLYVLYFYLYLCNDNINEYIQCTQFPVY